MAWFSKDKKQNYDHSTVDILDADQISRKAEGGKTMESKLQLVVTELQNSNLKHQIRTVGPFEFIEMGFSGDNLSVKIRVISLEDNSEFKVMSDDFAKIPQAKIESGYKLANSLNRTYKYVKFTIDNDGNVSAQWDLPDSVPSDFVGVTTVEIVLRMCKIIDSAYPEFMKTIWS